MLDFLKDTFGDEALTFDQLNERLSENESIKVVNGSYVPKEDYDAYKRDVEISREFAAAQVSDEVSVRANLDLDKVQFGEDGKLTGLTDQLNALKESKPYLFTQPQQQLELGGSTQGTGGDAPVKGIAGAVAEYYDK